MDAALYYRLLCSTLPSFANVPWHGEAAPVGGLGLCSQLSPTIDQKIPVCVQKLVEHDLVTCHRGKNLPAIPEELPDCDELFEDCESCIKGTPAQESIIEADLARRADESGGVDGAHLAKTEEGEPSGSPSELVPDVYGQASVSTTVPNAHSTVGSSELRDRWAARSLADKCTFGALKRPPANLKPEEKSTLKQTSDDMDDLDHPDDSDDLDSDDAEHSPDAAMEERALEATQEPALASTPATPPAVSHANDPKLAGRRTSFARSSQRRGRTKTNGNSVPETRAPMTAAPATSAETPTAAAAEAKGDAERKWKVTTMPLA
mgnify:CR=1 FL=1